MSAEAPAVSTIVVRRHPILRLLLVLGLVLGGFGAVAWSGAATPRVTVRSIGISGVQDQATGWTYVSVEVANHGRFPVDIDAASLVRSPVRPTSPPRFFVRDPRVAWEGRSYPADLPAATTIPDLRPFHPFTLAGGAERELVAVFEVRSPGDWPDDVEVTVTGSSGRSSVETLSGPPLGSWSTPTAC